MAYTDVDFSFGQTLTAAQMQTLSDNDAAFNDGTGILTLNDGWQKVTDAWSYSSVTGITGVVTIPSDGTTRYAIGDRIKFTQTTVKYFVVVAVTSTSISITGGSDYTLVNAAITDVYFSKWQTPVGFPAAFAYTPTLTNITIGNGVNTAAMTIVGRQVTIRGILTFGSSSSSGGVFTLAVPVTAANTTSIGSGLVVDASPGTFYLATTDLVSTANMTFHNNATSQAIAGNYSTPFTWTTSDSITWQLTYRI